MPCAVRRSSLLRWRIFRWKHRHFARLRLWCRSRIGNPAATPTTMREPFYAQEPSASAPAALLDVHPGMRVADLCAAPGGKTSQLAAALAGHGVLLANEFVAARAEVLRQNLERMGVTNAIVTNEDTARLAAAYPGQFDRILVDAPCSGEGMFRKESVAVTQYDQPLLDRCAALGADFWKTLQPCWRRAEF